MHINNQDSTAPMDIEQRMTSKRKIVNTRKERCNTIMQHLRAGEDERRTAEGKRPIQNEGCFKLVNNIYIEVRKLQPKQKEVLRQTHP